MRKYDVICVIPATMRVHSIPVKDVSRERGDYWLRELEKHSTGVLLVSIEYAGFYSLGELWRKTEMEEE